MRVLLWIVGFATFAFAVFVIGVVVASFIKEGLPKEIGEWLLVSGGLLCCITVVFTVVYLSDVYLKYGREELFVSLANLLFK